VEQSYLKVKQAAEIIGVKPVTVLRYIKAGKLKAYRLVKEYRLREEDVREFVEGKDAD